MDKCDLFVSEQQNVVYQAMHEIAKCKDYKDTGKLYDYVEQTPRTSFVVELVDQLNKNGYSIKKEEK